MQERIYTAAPREEDRFPSAEAERPKPPYAGRPARVRRKKAKSQVRQTLLSSLVHAAGWIAVILWVSFGSARPTPAPNADCGSEPIHSISEAAEPSGGTPAEPADGDAAPWNLRLVNAAHPLPERFETRLADVPGGEQVDERIYDALMELLNAASDEGLGPVVVSGYRTSEKQRSLYEQKIQKYLGQGYPKDEAVALAEQWVAKPGTSEHQSGLAVDINGATYDIYLWLQEHSYQYGFIFRYPGNKTAITGVAEEVWHYRYVGREAAREIYEQGICLEEYLENAAGEAAPDALSPEPDGWFQENGEWRRCSAASPI